MNFPSPNLPELAAPWGRAVEAALEAERLKSADLEGRLLTLQQQYEILGGQYTTLQGYIRTICQIAGYTYPPVASAPVPPPPVPDAPPAPVQRVDDFAALWSATWYQGYKRTSAGGTNDDRNSLYQRGSGYTYSMWRFDIGAARGKKITAASMYLSNISSYYNGGFVATLGTHGNVSEPAARQARSNAFDVGWTAGEAKWISLPSWTYDALSNGSIQGFTMGDNVADRQNFARFNGVGRSGAPILRLAYNS